MEKKSISKNALTNYKWSAKVKSNRNGSFCSCLLPQWRPFTSGPSGFPPPLLFGSSSSNHQTLELFWRPAWALLSFPGGALWQAKASSIYFSNPDLSTHPESNTPQAATLATSCILAPIFINCAIIHTTVWARHLNTNFTFKSITKLD